MARRRRGRAAPPTPDPDQPLDVVRIGQGVGDFETINGLPQRILTAALTVIAILLLRPLLRGIRAFLRG